MMLILDTFLIKIKTSSNLKLHPISMTATIQPFPLHSIQTNQQLSQKK